MTNGIDPDQTLYSMALVWVSSVCSGWNGVRNWSKILFSASLSPINVLEVKVNVRVIEFFMLKLYINPCSAEPGYTLPLQTV